jgi:carbon storage regulator
MLVLSRGVGQEIVIDGGIRVQVLGLCGGRVRIGVSAPRSVPVDRQEIALRRALFPDPPPRPRRGRRSSSTTREQPLPESKRPIGEG